jgi:hypothetical protein
VVEGRRGERKNRLISGLIGGLLPQSYQKRPYFPDLLHQPDLLIIPELGRLIVVFVYDVERQVGWGSALAWLEDLIEVKLSVGEHSVVSGILLAELDDIAAATQDIGLALGNTFDGFYFPNDWKPRLLAGDLLEKLIGLRRNSRLSQFLAAEHKQVSVELRRFDETKYKPLIDKSSTPKLRPNAVNDQIAHLIAGSVDASLEPNRFIPNIKGQLARLPRRFRFKFDIGIAGRENMGIDVIQSHRYGSREKLRYLMAKGRLLRYHLDGDRLSSRPRDFRPVLVVDGNISGPDYDPYRYVRALLSVGWELYQADNLEDFLAQ